MMVFIVFVVIFIVLVLGAMFFAENKGSNNVSTSSDSNTTPYRIDTKKTVDLKLPAPDPTVIPQYLLFDIQTTGFPIKRYASPEELDNWPYVLSFAYALIDSDFKVKESGYFLLKRDIDVPADATRVNGITKEMLLEKGEDLHDSLQTFAKAVEQCSAIVSHNLEFDFPIMEAEFIRNGFGSILTSKKKYCTYKTAKNIKYLDRKWFDGCSLEETLGNVVYDHLSVNIPNKKDASISLVLLYHIFKEMYSSHYVRLLRSFEGSPFDENGYIFKEAGEGFRYVEISPGYVSKVSVDAKNYTDDEQLNEISKLENTEPERAISLYLEQLSNGKQCLFLFHRLVRLYREIGQPDEEMKFIKKALSYVNSHNFGDSYKDFYKKRLITVETVYIPKKRVDDALSKGKVFEDNGDYESALNLYLQVMEDGDINNTIVKRVCICYRKMKRKDDEIAFINKMLETSELTDLQKNSLKKRLEGIK